MIRNEISRVLNEYTLDELRKNQKDLLKKANHICLGAYAPYWMFKLGASLILKNGQIINGSNQENVAYPSCLCAERVAMFNAGANFPNQKIKQIAIVARADFYPNKPFKPCDASRQAMIEYEQRQGEKLKYCFKETREISLF